MKRAETKDRIKEALEIRDMRQIELVEKTGIDKGQMSSYISGKYKPKQNNLHLIAEALSVDEAWLMGYDVPMERNDYEDPTLVRFDAIIEEAWKIIETAGYDVSRALPPDDDAIIVKDKNGLIILCLPDYELVNKYESLQRKGEVTAESLLIDKEAQYIIDKVYAFDCQLKALGWEYKIMVEPDPHSNDHPLTYALFKNDSISFKVSGNDYNDFINDAEDFYKERLRRLLDKSSKQLFVEKYKEPSHFTVKAAHERTDIEVTDEMRQHDDDIMNDDSEWE